MDSIVLKNMIFYGHTGVFEEEKVKGQKFVITIEIRFDRIKGCDTDNLADTADYSVICDKAKEIALRRVIEKLEEDEGVTMDDFFSALTMVKSSVNADDEKRMRLWDGSQSDPE